MIISIEKMMLYGPMIDLMRMKAVDVIQWKNILCAYHGSSIVWTYASVLFSKRRTSEWLKLSKSIVTIL